MQIVYVHAGAGNENDGNDCVSTMNLVSSLESLIFIK